jgi:hypothetical protein
MESCFLVRHFKPFCGVWFEGLRPFSKKIFMPYQIAAPSGTLIKHQGQKAYLDLSAFAAQVFFCGPQSRKSMFL